MRLMPASMRPCRQGGVRPWRLHGSRVTTDASAADVIVSELTTNAILTSRLEGRPFIRLILTLDQGELVILVRDFCPGIPQHRDAGDQDENGRGLFLVQAMSDQSGWYPSDDGTPGKVVWAVARSE
jgi:anti-sigma regulatory factor (Ser/Thr protein kinase)